jgi:hypothetical protein
MTIPKKTAMTGTPSVYRRRVPDPTPPAASVRSDSCLSSTPSISGLKWNDLSSQLDRRTISKAASKAVEAAVATVDHSDIRGSEPHNRDPSGATSD